MSSRDYDLFFASADGATVTHLANTNSTTAAATLRAEGTEFAVSSSASFAVGQHVMITDAPATPDVVTYCVITRKADATHLTLRPLFSDADTGNVSGVDHEFPSGSVIDGLIGADACTLVVDLAEAPDTEYQYVVAACGYLSSGASDSRVLEAWVRRSLLDDPWSGDKYGEARITFVNTAGADTEPYNYVGASHHVLKGGQRYEFRLQFRGTTAPFAAKIARPRMVAIRIDPATAYIAGDGKTAETSSTGPPANHVALTANVVPAGDYLVIASWLANSSSTSTGTETTNAYLEDNGGLGIVARETFNGFSTSDYYPAGFLGFLTIGATNEWRIRIDEDGAGTSKVRHGLLAVIRSPAVAAMVSQAFTGTDDNTLANDQWASLRAVSPQTLARGHHIEVMQFSSRCTERHEVRPKYPGITDPTGKGLHGLTLNGSGTRHATFFFHRILREAGAYTNELEGRIPADPTGGMIRLQDVYFSWLRENAQLAIKPESPVAIVADIETGVHLKKMAAGGATDRYKKALPDVAIVTAVKVNSVAYTEKTSTGAMSASTWFWSASTRELYIQFPSGDTASDSDIFVVATAMLYAGRCHEDLKLPDGSYRPYADRLENSPGVDQDLQSSDGKLTTGTQLGSLDLANADGEYDDEIKTYRWVGRRCRLWRGYPELSSELRDFSLILDGVIGRPQGEETLTLPLLDRGEMLRRPVMGLASVAVKEGFGADARTRENQEMPVLYGKHLRIVAYRTEADETGGGDNLFQFATNAVDQVLAAYLDADGKALTVTTHWSAGAGELAAGKVLVKNAAFPTTTQPADVVYVDVVGKPDAAGDPIQTQGAIWEDALLSYAGLAETDIVRATVRGVDRLGRKQISQTAGVPVPPAPNVALRIDPGESVADALDRLCAHTFMFWGQNRQGRFYLNLPDRGFGNLLTNSFAEIDDFTVWPWEIRNSATIAVSTSRSFQVGRRSFTIGNGSNTAGYVVQKALFPRTGDYVVTLAALSLTGNAANFRIAVLAPDGEEILSVAHATSTTKWTRITLALEVGIGQVGEVEVRLYPAHGSTTSTTLAVDAIECFPLACTLEATNSEIESVEFEEEDYFEGAVQFSVNQQDAGRAATAVVKDAVALGLSTTEPEGKHLVDSSTRAFLEGSLVADGASAQGIASALAGFYGRPRPRMRVRRLALPRIPVVGELVMHRNHPRVPETSDSYPIHKVVGVSYDGDDANVIELEVIQQADPAWDRMEVI